MALNDTTDVFDHLHQLLSYEPMYFHPIFNLVQEAKFEAARELLIQLKNKRQRKTKLMLNVRELAISFIVS